jgi:enoyl-CoA hydratase/carnithine racemase
MDRGGVTYEKRESIALITLNRLYPVNTFSSDVAARLKDIQSEISGDIDIRVIIVTGTGGETFSMVSNSKKCSREGSGTGVRKPLHVSRIIDRFDRPCIGAIRGGAYGQGLELALACDLRICTETAHFSMNHLTYGDIPWDGGTQRLARLIGKPKAIEMILTGEVIYAQEAHRIGLVHRVVTEAELLPAAMDMAREIATRSSIAVRYAKEAINKGMDFTLEQGMRLEADLYFLLHTTKDRTEGIRAFQEKRTPVFEGK